MTIEERGYSANFTKIEQIIFEFIINNKERACFLTVSDIAQELNIGDTSVIRLAKTLGFNSFGQFKKALQSEVAEKNQQRSIGNIPYEKIKNVNALKIDELANVVRENYIKKAEKDLNANHDKKYMDIVHLLLHGNNKYVAGFRNSSGMAEYFSTILSHILPHVRSVNKIGGFEDDLIDLTPDDIVVIFSFPRYSQNALMVLEMAKDVGCKIIVFTDKLTSPLANGANKVVVNDVDSLSFANSFSSVMLSIEIITTLVSKLNEKQGAERLKHLDCYLDRTGQY